MKKNNSKKIIAYVVLIIIAGVLIGGVLYSIYIHIADLFRGDTWAIVDPSVFLRKETYLIGAVVLVVLSLLWLLNKRSEILSPESEESINSGSKAGKNEKKKDKSENKKKGGR
jgi:membrane protease YdiL (CAAX protease family)